MTTQPACGSCGQGVSEGDLSECTTCAAKFCGQCSLCDCDRIRELMEDLTALANATGRHRDLLAALRVVYKGLKPVAVAA